MTANPKTSVPRRDEATRQSVPTPDGKKAESLPAPPDLSSKEEARAWNSEKRQDEVLLVAGKLLNQVLSMPQWKQQMDLAKLAVEIARGKPDTTPRSCIREASELMLAAADEMEWMMSGKSEEEEKQRDDEALQGIYRKVNAPLPDPHGWDDLVPWESLCHEGKNKKPETLVLPDGSEFEAYSRAEKLKELAENCPKVISDVKGWMKLAREGKLRKFDLHSLALFRAKKSVSNKVAKIVGEDAGQFTPK